MSAVDTLDAREYIIIKGARVHNLKNVDLAIPRGKFVVITGLSGSGKSSLAFDTLYAEGQRRYVESLSSYARQFMGRLNKPDVDYIKGISPAIAIEQKVNTRNPRSTVGTSTEIYDFLKLLFARAGKTYSPISDLEVKKNSVSDIVDFILKQPDQKKCILFTTITGTEKRTLKECLGVLSQQGFARIMFKDEIIRIDEAPTKIKETDKKNVYLIIDRFAISHDDEFMNRVSDSVQTALYEGNNECYLRAYSDDKTFEDRFFSSRFELDGISFEEPTVNLFAFNNPFGACKTCEGYGSVIGIDENLVVPNKNLSVYDGAIACWRGPTMKEYQEEFILKAYKHDFPVHRPYNELNKKEKVLLWEGTKGLSGLNSFFKFLE